MGESGTKARSFADAKKRFFDKTPTSRQLSERATKVMPAGVTRHALQSLHYPIVGVSGKGAFMYDADGNAYLDMVSGSGATTLGQAHPDVVAAVHRQIDQGFGFPTTNAIQIELAELIQQRIPSMELMRFASSGTEATMFALRLARAFTGKMLIARNEVSYHGLHDMMMSGQGSTLGGTWLQYNENPVSAGVLPHVREGVVFTRFNDLQFTEQVIEAHKDELAAMIVEPFYGTAGGIEAAPGYLQGLEQICKSRGILLIFDEMVSIGMDYHGAQGFYGVHPDMTTTGKMVGGGMPIGVFGGRREIMEMLIPDEKGVPPVMHSGTWNGHPVCMQAGVETLKLMTKEVHAYLCHIGDYMRTKLRARADAMGIPFQATGVAQFSGFHFNDQPVRLRADVLRDDNARMQLWTLSLLSQGYLTLGTRTNLNAAITEADIDGFVDAAAIAFEESVLE
ncbi:glutamate-1-semialdehyde 2,1-aminomutase [soil metagenome]